MSLQIQVELDNGVTCQFAKITQCEIDYENNVCNITTTLWLDAAAYDANKSELMNLTNSVSGDDFETYFSNTVLAQLDVTPLGQCVQYLLDKVFVGATVI